MVPYKKKFNNKKRASDKSGGDDEPPTKNAYKRAQETYERIQRERREFAEARRQEKQKRIDATAEYVSIKKKMNKALCRRNKKGQPKLDAQVAVLVEKIQRRQRNE